MKKLVCLAFLLFLIPGAALAQRWEFSVSGVTTNLGKPKMGSLSTTDNKDTDTSLRGKNGLAARLTFNHHGYFGHEFTYMVHYIDFRTTVKTQDEDDEEVVTTQSYSDHVRTQIGAYNFLIYMMPQGERWRPFFTAGLESVRWGGPKFSAWPGGGSKNFGFNFGGGLKIKLFKHAQLRIDVRDYLSGKPYNQLTLEDETFLTPGTMRTLEGSVGFGITF